MKNKNRIVVAKSFRLFFWNNEETSFIFFTLGRESKRDLRDAFDTLL